MEGRPAAARSRGFLLDGRARFFMLRLAPRELALPDERSTVRGVECGGRAMPDAGRLQRQPVLRNDREAGCALRGGGAWFESHGMPKVAVTATALRRWPVVQ